MPCVISSQHLDSATVLHNTYCLFATSFDYSQSAETTSRRTGICLNISVEAKGPKRLVSILHQEHPKLTRLGDPKELTRECKKKIFKYQSSGYNVPKVTCDDMILKDRRPSLFYSFYPRAKMRLPKMI